MTMIIQNQIALILLSFSLGGIGTIAMFIRNASDYSWKVADLVWVILGGVGAVTAVIAGIYSEDSSRLDRQIDVAFALSQEFDRDTARFRLSYCELDPADLTHQDHVKTLCDKVEFLAASTSGSQRLPLFLNIARRNKPLSSLRILPSFGADARQPETSFEGMVAQAEGFDPTRLFYFDARDDNTNAAIVSLGQSTIHVGKAAEFEVIAGAYDDLINQVMQLREEWEYLQSNNLILALQIIAIALVAFAAPFRVGKSIVELR